MKAPRPRYPAHSRIFGSLVLLSLLWAISLLHHRPSPSSLGPALPARLQAGNTLELFHLDQPFQAPVYPYSVIPGGVSGREGLRSAVAADPVVARHYAGFHLDAARVIQFQAPRFAYVSYRRGNEIFWTLHKIKIPAGESLLFDGTNLVRARCGNRLSEVPKTPTSPQDPPPRVMDDPIPQQQPPLIFQPEPPFISEWTPEQPNSPIFLPPLIGEEPPTNSGSRPIPPIPPVFGLPTGGMPPLAPPPRPISTPEPATLTLLLAGAFWIAISYRKQSN